MTTLSTLTSATRHYTARLALASLLLAPLLVSAEARHFEINIEDTRITLVDKQDFHTFAFNGQVPGPLIHVKEGDEVTVDVNNLTTLPHTIHWHGLLQRNSWQMDGVPDVTQPAIKPGESFTYKWIAEPSGTMWYHCHVNVNEHVAMRGMFGPLIIEPKDPIPVEKEVTKEFILLLSDWASAYAFKPGYGGVAGDVWDFFTINGKAFPDSQPMRIKTGDVVRIRFIGAGEFAHSIHIHGHIFKVVFRDGRPLSAPYDVDTVTINPGERYDVILRADNPGRWMVHDHVDSHTVNGSKPMGGMMTVLEYTDLNAKDNFYVWRDKEFVPDFYYEESMAKPFDLHNSPVFQGQLIEE